MTKFLSLLTALGLAFMPLAQAQRTEDSVELRRAVQAALGKEAKIDSVRDAGILGLVEVVVGGDVLYTDQKGSYIFAGDLIETKTRKNISEIRRGSLSGKLLEAALPIAIKTVRGNGKRVLYTFEDPNCGYCRKLASELQKVDNITVYTYLLPVLSADSAEKAKAVWCAKDRVKAWNDLMLRGTVPTMSGAKCDAPLDKLLALGEQLRVHGTPALFFTSGTRVPGFVTADQIEKLLN